MGLHLAGCKVIGGSASSANWVAEIPVLLAHFGPVTHDHPHHEGCLGREPHGQCGSRMGACFAGHRGNPRQVLSGPPLVL